MKFWNFLHFWHDEESRYISVYRAVLYSNISTVSQSYTSSIARLIVVKLYSHRNHFSINKFEIKAIAVDDYSRRKPEFFRRVIGSYLVVFDFGPFRGIRYLDRYSHVADPIVGVFGGSEISA